MKQFEYDWKQFKGTCINDSRTIESLNELGKEGWELCGTPEGCSDMMYPMSGFFKREIIQNKEK